MIEILADPNVDMATGRHRCVDLIIHTLESSLAHTQFNDPIVNI